MRILFLMLINLGVISVAAADEHRSSSEVEVAFPGAESIEAGEVIFVQGYDRESDTYIVFTQGRSTAGPFAATPANLAASTGHSPISIVGVKVKLRSDLKLTLQNALKLRREYVQRSKPTGV